jgi:hypothetical protein
MDVVDKIKTVETTSMGRHGDVPKNADEVMIKSVRRA